MARTATKARPTTQASPQVMRSVLEEFSFEDMGAARFWGELAVNVAYYAVFVTLGIMGVGILAAMIPNAFLSSAFFIFGFVIALYASLYTAGKITPPTMIAFDYISDKAQRGYHATREWLSAKREGITFFQAPSSVQ